MKRLPKFLHSVAGAAMIGALAAMAVILLLAPTTSDARETAPILIAASQIAAWVLAPSLLLTLLTGMLAMAASPGYQDVAWVWVKAATGILVFEVGLKAIGPIQEEAKRNAAGLASDPATLQKVFESALQTVWILLGVAVVNVALGVWRPRFPTFRVK